VTPAPVPAPERTLDPQDWDSLRQLGHRMVDDMLEYLATVRDRPCWQPVPDYVRSRLAEPVPMEPTPEAAV